MKTTSNRRRRFGRHSLCLLGMAVLSTTTLPAVAEPAATVPSSLAARLQTQLHTRYPATHFGAVNTTPWPGVFEVVMGAKLVYVDAGGQYFLFGHLYDMQAQRDITAAREEQLTRIDFSSLPLSDALKEVRGNGSRTLVIFSDPDCPYYHRLDATLKGLTDVTIFTFMMPLPSLHPQARQHAIAVWCAANRIDVWHRLMRGEYPSSDAAGNDKTRSATNAAAPCAHPIDRNIALGERLGISGTPTLVAADGRMLPGAGTLTQIEAWLSPSAASTSGPAR